MINYENTHEGDLLRIVKAGAPGFAANGDIVEVTRCNHVDTLCVKRADGEEVYFRDHCGAGRLDHVLALPLRAARREFANDLKAIDHDDAELNTEIMSVTETIDRETAWLEALTAERQYRGVLAQRSRKEGQTNEDWSARPRLRTPRREHGF